MLSTIRDLLDTADPRTVFLSIGVSLVVVALTLSLQAIVPVVRWAASSLRLQILLRKNRPITNKDDKSDGAVSVSGLFVHPVKSMRSISLSESTLDPKGLTNDRRFMVVYELPLPVYQQKWGPGDLTHRFLTQRQCPSLATISATITTSTSTTTTTGNERVLVLEQQNGPQGANKKSSNNTIHIPLTHNKTHYDSAVAPIQKTHLAGIWDDVVAVDDMGDEAAAFLQAIVNADDELLSGGGGGAAAAALSNSNSNQQLQHRKTVRLVTASRSESSASSLFLSTGTDNRSYIPAYAKTWKGGFLGKPTLTDGFPILIASEASLEHLNQKLVKGGKEAIAMSRFRPNIVLKGKSLKPFEEDNWKVIVIGTTVFAIVKACPRCKQSCTDQVTGSVSSEPLATMASFRRSEGDQPPNGAVFFAQNAIPIGNRRLDEKTIRVGDTVRILERGDPVYID